MDPSRETPSAQDPIMAILDAITRMNETLAEQSLTLQQQQTRIEALQKRAQQAGDNLGPMDRVREGGGEGASEAPPDVSAPGRTRNESATQQHTSSSDVQQQTIT